MYTLCIDIANQPSFYMKATTFRTQGSKLHYLSNANVYVRIAIFIYIILSTLLRLETFMNEGSFLCDMFVLYVHTHASNCAECAQLNFNVNDTRAREYTNRARQTDIILL